MGRGLARVPRTAPRVLQHHWPPRLLSGFSASSQLLWQPAETGLKSDSCKEWSEEPASTFYQCCFTESVLNINATKILI